MVNWQEAGKTWPQPHHNAVHLLRGLVWDQHYRHSNPQCKRGMPGSFELREDMGADRLQAVEDWLRVERYAYRLRQKRWRVWTRPDRPGEVLRPNGIEDDEDPNEYRSGATMNVSMWDIIEKKFREPAQERTLQGGSGASPGEKNFIEVPKRAKAKPRQLSLRKSCPSSDVESAHRGRRPADEASSSSGAASNQRDLARACERVCGVLCNLRVARQRATEQNAAVGGAVCIAQHEAAEWEQGMAIHASAAAAITAGLTAAAAQEAVDAQVRREAQAAAREAAAAPEARLAQEAIARKEGEVKALEEALAQERARKEAEEKAHAEALAHAEATAKAQADAARRDVIEAARQKVAEERAKTKAELKGLEEQKAWLQQVREAEAARAREEAERRAAEGTAAAMEEAEGKIKRETPPGGSRVDTL